MDPSGFTAAFGDARETGKQPFWCAEIHARIFYHD